MGVEELCSHTEAEMLSSSKEKEEDSWLPTPNVAEDFLNKLKHALQNDGRKYSKFLNVIKAFKEERIDVPCLFTSLNELLQGRPTIASSFSGHFLPKGYTITREPSWLTSLAAADLVTFLYKIKERFQANKQVFLSFVNLLEMYKLQGKSLIEFRKEVPLLFGDHTDLIEELNYHLNILLESEKAPRLNSSYGKSSYEDKTSAMPLRQATKAKHGEISPSVWDKRDHHRLPHGQELVKVNESKMLIGKEKKNKKQYSGKLNFVAEGLDQSGGKVERVEPESVIREMNKHAKSPPKACEDSDFDNSSLPIKEFSKCSVLEYDLSNCQQPTPSYRLLPERYPISEASEQRDLDEEVLNKHLLLVAPGREDFSYKHMKKNKYEGILFRCEDDRCVLDLMIGSVNATIDCLEKLLNETHDNEPICIEDYFTAVHMSLIERIYGEHGLEVKDMLQKNASFMLPLILSRLKQKQGEWSQYRTSCEEIWAKAFEKFHDRSLDHRSMYFE